MTSYKQFTKDMNRDKHNSDRRLPWQNYYWCLGSLITPTLGLMARYLEVHKFYVTGRAAGDIVRLTELTERCEQGLLSYDPCKLPELQRFAIDRGLLKQVAARRLHKADMIEFLETADKKLIFPSFLKLPAELRNEIYEMYFESIGTLPARFRQPPITLANRQMRAEALPLFYGTCTFRFHITPKTKFAPDWFYDDRSLAFIKSVSQETISSIRKLVLVATSTSRRVSLAWRFDLQTGAGRVEQEIFCPRTCYELQPDGAYNVKVELQKAVDVIMARGGERKLRKEDFEAFVEEL